MMHAALVHRVEGHDDRGGGSVNCPYHLDMPAQVPVPGGAEEEGGWIAWLEGCCGLPAWRCPSGALHAIDARYCILHGCERPHVSRVAHEVAHGQGMRRDVAAPPLVARQLEIAPHGGGTCTPCLAGNVLVYLTQSERLIAIDARLDAAVFLAAQVRAAALKVRAGHVLAALRTEAGVRYLSWDIRDLREALRKGGRAVRPRTVGGMAVHLLGLPRDRTRLHQGSGPLRLVVEHDPLPDGLAEQYERVTGVRPGAYLVRRTPNPQGPELHHPDLRPQLLHQVPVPVPGGVFLIGQIRWFGQNVAGALLVPTFGGRFGTA